MDLRTGVTGRRQRWADRQNARLLSDHQASLRRWQSEAELNEAQRLGKMGSWEWDVASGALRLSESLRSIYGLEGAERPTMDDIAALVHPDDRAI